MERLRLEQAEIKAALRGRLPADLASIYDERGKGLWPARMMKACFAYIDRLEGLLAAAEKDRDHWKTLAGPTNQDPLAEHQQVDRDRQQLGAIYGVMVDCLGAKHVDSYQSLPDALVNALVDLKCRAGIPARQGPVDADEAGQNEAGQNEVGQDEADQDEADQDEAGQNRAADDQVGQGKSVHWVDDTDTDDHEEEATAAEAAQAEEDARAFQTAQAARKVMASQAAQADQDSRALQTAQTAQQAMASQAARADQDARALQAAQAAQAAQQVMASQAAQAEEDARTLQLEQAIEQAMAQRAAEAEAEISALQEAQAEAQALALQTALAQGRMSDSDSEVIIPLPFGTT